LREKLDIIFCAIDKFAERIKFVTSDYIATEAVA